MSKMQTLLNESKLAQKSQTERENEGANLDLDYPCDE